MSEENMKQNECCHDHNHDCGHDHEHCHDESCGCGETVTLAFDDGKEMLCNVLGVFEALGREYIALLPVGEEEVVLFRHEQMEDASEITSIEDDEEYDAVVAAFEEIFVDDVE